MAETYGAFTTLMQQTGGYNPRLVLDVPDEQRLDLMRKMGVANTEPQLPHSPALKSKKTGAIFPWLEILANQSDQFVCCDIDGNEDENVWGPKVVLTNIDNRELSIMAQAQALQRRVMDSVQAPYRESEQKSPLKIDTSGKTEYEKQGVTSFKDVQYTGGEVSEQEVNSPTSI